VGIMFLLALVILTHKPYYTVSTTLLFEAKSSELVFADKEWYLHRFGDWMRTQTHEIESPEVLNRALKNHKKSGFTWIEEGESEKTAADRLRGRLDLKQIEHTQLMTIGLGSGNKEGLAELVNFVVIEYINLKDQKRKEQDQKKLSHLRTEQKKYNLRLDEAYKDLKIISEKLGTGISDVKSLNVNLDMLIDLKSRYNKTLTQRIEAENRLLALKNQRARIKNLNIYDLKNSQSLMEMEQEINTVMVGLKSDSPLHQQYSNLLEEINTQNIETTRKYLISKIDQEINEQTTIFETAFNSEKDLKVEVENSQREVQEINTGVLMTSAQRQNIDRIINIWDRINDRIEQIEIELFNPGRVSVLNAALSPELPDPSKLIKKVLLSIIAILGFSFGLASFKEIRDKKVKRVQDIEKVMGFPVSGYLLDSRVENIEPEKLEEIYKAYPNSYMTELYNQLAIRIEKENLEHGSQSFALFSLKGKSGVTSVAKNMLAMLDADKHEKILVDLHEDHPLLKKEDDYDRESGLIHWLAVNRNLENGILSEVDSFYDILPLGSIREMSIARIRPSAVNELLNRLKKRYKYIFIDGPPMLISSEAQTVANLADVSMLVLNAQKDTWPELLRTVNILDKLKVGVISLILNRVQIKRAGYFSKMIKEYAANKIKLNKSEPLGLAGGGHG